MIAHIMPQHPPQDDARQQYPEAVQHILRWLDDLDLGFRFATVARRIGDFKGAVSALEGGLHSNANLPRVRLKPEGPYYGLGKDDLGHSPLGTDLYTHGFQLDLSWAGAAG